MKRRENLGQTAFNNFGSKRLEEEKVFINEINRCKPEGLSEREFFEKLHSIDGKLLEYLLAKKDGVGKEDLLKI